MTGDHPGAPGAPGARGAPGGIPPWREPVRGGHPDAGHLALTGAQQMRAMLDGESPSPPIARLLGVRLVEFEPGAATFELPLSGWLRAADGRVPLGPLVMPPTGPWRARSCLGCPSRSA